MSRKRDGLFLSLAASSALVWFCGSALPFQAETDPGDDLDRAVAALRHVVPDDLSGKEQGAKAREIGEAWQRILDQGEEGYRRLKMELGKIDAAQEKDDFFKLGAAALIWELKKIDGAEEIGRLYGEVDDLNLQYNYVFIPTFRAAASRDKRALPMMRVCLGDDQGTCFLQKHALDLKWPLTIDFIWGAFGPAGLPVLAEALQKGNDTVTLQSALHLVTGAQYLEALPRIRKLAAHDLVPVRCTAVRCLGVFGHPDDYGLLVEGLNAGDPDVVTACAGALGEYQDLRAVEHLLPLLESDQETLRRQVLSSLAWLLCPDALRAIRDRWVRAEEGPEKTWCERYVDRCLGQMDMTWEAFKQKEDEELDALFLSLHEKGWRDKYALSETDRELTHDQLLEAAAAWKENRRITGGEFGWVEDRHLFTAATGDDVELLLEVRASVYTRLSDECLHEVRTLNRLIKWLGRSRYRKVPALCRKVEPVR